MHFRQFVPRVPGDERSEDPAGVAMPRPHAIAIPRNEPHYTPRVSNRRNYNTPNHAHELTFSCYRKYAFLEKDRTRQWLADAINQACRKHAFRLWAYVFMSDHAHLLVWPTRPEYDIAALRRSIKSPVAIRAINHLKKHDPAWLDKITRQRGGRTERLFWQPGGGYDRNIDNPATLAPVIDYIHQNPVRRGLVKRAEDWHWSSASWYLDMSSPNPCHLSQPSEFI